jgi:hypothetical protein
MTKQKELEVEDAMAEYVITYERDVLEIVSLEVSDEALETAERTDSPRSVTLAACTSLSECPPPV